MKGRSTDIAHSRRVGKNWVMTGLWSGHSREKKKSDNGLKRSEVNRENSVGGSDPQTLHRPGDVELVHCVDNDGGGGEEEEQQEE